MNGLLPAEIERGGRAPNIAALDELFEASRTYRTSERFQALLRFITRFRRYSPFNCCLLHIQRPSVSYVATASHWRLEFNRTVKPDARPLVILAPMHPVMFVFDAEDTEGDALPPGLVDPFVTEGKLAPGVWEHTVGNLPRDRILFSEAELERARAGFICEAGEGEQVIDGERAQKALYRLQINSILARAAKYATVVHELGHLYAGHMGTPDERWWPHRPGLPREQEEFEAESICHLVCTRVGIKTESDAYLSGYLKSNQETPAISLDRVLKAAGMIESMGKKRLAPRKRLA